MAAFKGVVATADYTFDKTAKTITFSANYTGIALSDIMYITNVKSATATVIYDPSNAALGGSLSSLVLTLAYDTSAMLSADPLQIIVAMGTLAAKVTDTAIPALGQTTKSASLPVTTASNEIALEVIGSASSQDADLIASTDVQQYRWVSIQLSGTWFGTITFYGSNNGTGFSGISLQKPDELTGITTGAVTTNGLYHGLLPFRYFKITFTTYGSGTATATVEFNSTPTGQNFMAVKQQGTWNVGLNSGSSLVGKVGIDQTTPGTTNLVALTAETTKVIGTINVAASQTIAVTNTGTFAVQATPVTQADTFMLGGVNVKEINAVAPLMGSGVMGTGSLRVTIASDNDPLIVKQATAANLNATVVGTGNFVVQATLAAETTKVIGTVNVASSQTIAVTQATASNLNMTEASAANILTKLTAGAASMVKLEDVAAADADAGVPAMAVRKATPANTSNADGDYEMLQMSAGRLWVDASGVTLTANATLTAETTKVIGTINVAASQTIAVTNTGTFAVQATPVTQADTFMLGGINVKEINAVTPLMGAGNTGTGSLRVTIATDQATVATTPAGNVASGASDSGNPIKIGFVAMTANPTAVTDGQRVNSRADKLGRVVMVLNQVRDLKAQQTTTIAASTSETTVLTAGAAGVLHDITLITIANTSATDARVDFRDATAGSVIFSVLAKAGQTTGFATNDPVQQTTAANNWTAQSSASITDLRIFVKAVKNL